MPSQPTPTLSDDDIDRVTARDFSADEKANVFAILREYGTESWHRECTRVRMAALKNAGGDIERLRQEINIAKCDYRDTLATAEYPEYSRRGSLSMPDDEKVRIYETDWRQYQKWLHK